MKTENNTNDDFYMCCGVSTPEDSMVCRSCQIGNSKIAPQKTTNPAKGFKKIFGRIEEF